VVQELTLTLISIIAFTHSINQSFAMHFLDKVDRVAPATTTAYVEDPKENAILQGTNAETELENPNQRHIPPRIENVVRRKLDWHVIPLVSALCSYLAISALARKRGTCAKCLGQTSLLFLIVRT